MATLGETAGVKTELGAGLAAGVNTLSLNQTVNFTLYVKLVLPLDGYVFWVNASLLTDTALFNAAQYNQIEFNNLAPVPVPPRVLQAQGSLHYSSEFHMMEDRNTTFNRMIFTSLHPIQELNQTNPNFLYIATVDNLKFAFSRRENYYRQADLYHYRGDAVYSAMQSQVIDTMTGFDTTNVIVSNSLPIWLTLNKYFPMYPSYLTESNLAPPFAAVDINPRLTEAIQAAPRIFPNSSHYQLAKDTVKITIYGTRNYTALEFQDYVFQYTLDTDNMGVMNMPIIQDEKLTQAELGVIAMKKSITFDVSYYQQNVRNVAIQYIRSAFINIEFD